MADSFSHKIGLKGVQEFKKSLADINASFKVLGLEMKPASSQFDKNDKPVQALSARNTILNKGIEAKKQKIGQPIALLLLQKAHTSSRPSLPTSHRDIRSPPAPRSAAYPGAPPSGYPAFPSYAQPQTV